MKYLICYVINLSSTGYVINQHFKTIVIQTTSRQRAYELAQEHFKEVQREFGEHFLSAAVTNLIEL